MDIIVNNLGPIREARIDLGKRISVFCGPNNTGKTYLSYVLYAFTRQRIIPLEERLTDAQVNDFMTRRSFRFQIDEERVYDEFFKRQESSKGDLATVFGISESAVEKLFPDFSMHIDISKNAFVDYLRKREIDLTMSHKQQLLAKVVKKSGENVVLIQNISNRATNDSWEEIKADMSAQIYKLLLFPVFFSHFFPVERNSLYTYFKDIQANRGGLMQLLQRLENGARQALVDYISQNSGRYPMAISYTMDAAYKLSTFKEDRGYYANLADEIERDILGGKIAITDNGDMEFISYRIPQKNLPLYLTASMTKSLSGLVYCLRHVAGKYDMIFIDEPEVNCHPNAQILMARIFGKMVNAGLRLVVSTHSDYIIRELNNLIMLSGAPEYMDEQLHEWGYTRNMAINTEDVGAYLFNYDDSIGKVNVTPIEVDRYGFEVRTIDESIDKQNNISESLYYELRYGQNKQ